MNIRSKQNQRTEGYYHSILILSSTVFELGAPEERQQGAGLTAFRLALVSL